MEFILAHLVNTLPTTLGGYATQIILGMIVAIICGSFVEYFMHRYVMHRGIRLFGKMYLFAHQHHSHAALHHGTFYKQFDHEDDPVGREESLRFSTTDIAIMQLVLLPALLFIAWFSPIIALCVSLVALLHNNLWNIIHHEMHQPKHPAWSKWAFYRLLARNHLLHHRHTGTHFNVVFPLADYILGTAAEATQEDLSEIARLGYGAS